MKKLWEAIGLIGFWTAWPLIYVYSLNRSRASIIVVNQSKILLVKNWLSSGKWSLPGGGIAKAESAVACARRELIEELGISPKPEDLKLVMKGWFRESGLRFYHECFRLELKEKPNLKIRNLEIMDAKWFGKSELPKARLSGEAKQAIKAWS